MPTMRYSISIIVCFSFFCYSAYAETKGKLIFRAGFTELLEEPQTAPTLPLQTETAEGEATVDFNNLKDPKYTPKFKPRNPIKFQVPGFSSCFVNRFGTMAIDLVKKGDYVWLHGENPKVSGYVGKQFLKNQPTSIQATIQRVDPSEGGSVFLRISDVISGAYIHLSSLGIKPDSPWALSYNNERKWKDWQIRNSSITVDWTKPVSLRIGLIEPGIFQAYINDKPFGTKIVLPALHELSELRVGGAARLKGLKLLEVSAWRDTTLASDTPSTRKVTVPVKLKGLFLPANPYGAAVQIDYPYLGFADAMADEAQFEELAEVLEDMHYQLLRFPGGNSAYFYSIHGPKTMDALWAIRQPKYTRILDPKVREHYRWSDTRQFFRLCKRIGADAMYQLNMGYWVDPETMRAYRIAVQDSGQKWPPPKGMEMRLQGKVRPLVYHCNKLKDAISDARTIARWANEIGVKVIWEFGNEDLVYFSPKVYVDICHAFYDAIREVDPEAEFCIYGDGITWSDWRWPFAVFKEMAKQQLDIAYTSHHEYIFGGTGIRFVDGQHTYDGIVAGWNNITELRTCVRRKLDSLGYTETRLAMTEGNMAASGPMVGKPHEHGMGRALAEATIFPERIRTYATLIYHDLVRSHPPGKQGQSWFARLYYYPENPPGKRYGLPTDAAVMRIMNEHAQREIIYADNGICVSQNADGLLLSACNPLPMECPFEFDLQNLTTGGTVHADILHAENLDTARYKKQTRPIALSPVSEETTLRFKAPKFSFTSIRIPAE